ncbi:MAG: hypothetical protein L6R19_17940 [Alphaproteobacteria bacterium]|nr:hypothetical protein [Alphaproteobacteria bacterium]
MAQATKLQVAVQGMPAHPPSIGAIVTCSCGTVDGSNDHADSPPADAAQGATSAKTSRIVQSNRRMRKTYHEIPKAQIDMDQFTSQRGKSQTVPSAGAGILLRNTKTSAITGY